MRPRRVFRFRGRETRGAIRLGHLNPQTQEFTLRADAGNGDGDDDTDDDTDDGGGGDDDDTDDDTDD